MFNLLRYFSATSAIVLIVVTAALVFLYRQNAVEELVESAESQNIVLARSFANTLWPHYSGFVASVSGLDGDALRARPETQDLHQALRKLTAGLPVLKVKIYNLDGLTVYSSQISQMGADKSHNMGFLRSAEQGKTASEHTYRDSFAAFSGTVNYRDLVESYLPIWGNTGAVEGVFELYTDVTPLIARVERNTINLAVGLTFVFGLMYAVLFLIVRRADGILKHQYTELLTSGENIKEKNRELQEAHNTLERRVRERTTELEKEISERQRTEVELEQRVHEIESAKQAIEKRSAEVTALAEDLAVARDQANAANRTKSEFLAMMSHELRTPLNAILGFSEIIATETCGPVGSAKYRDYADDIHESGQHLLHLINDILDLSKVESGLDTLNEEDVEIPALIDSVLRLLEQRAKERGIELELEQPKNLPALRADERKMKQILSNLLSNAIKFTKAGGHVILKVQCHAESGHIFQVVDSGIGIAPEDIPKALSQFGQVDSALNRQHEGSGLGLPLTKSLIELHGGSLGLQSELGVGTRITVRFPAERIVKSPAQATSSSVA